MAEDLSYPYGYGLLADREPYPGAPRPDRDGPALTLMPGHTEITMFMSRPAPREVAAVRTGRAEFAWVPSAHAGLLCFRLGALPWWDAPYMAHRASAQGWPETVVPGMHKLLFITLVDRQDGITRALRPLTWPPSFTATVRDAVTRQLELPRDDAAAGEELAALWALGDSEYLARTLGQGRCTGGPAAARKPGLPRPGTAPRPAGPR